MADTAEQKAKIEKDKIEKDTHKEFHHYLHSALCTLIDEFTHGTGKTSLASILELETWSNAQRQEPDHPRRR